MHAFIKIGNTIINTAQIVSINLEKAPEYVSIDFADRVTRGFREFAPELYAYFSGNGSYLKIGNEGSMVELIEIEQDEIEHDEIEHDEIEQSQLYRPDFSADGAEFWIVVENYDCNFVSYQEARAHGAVVLSEEQDLEAHAAYAAGGRRGITYKQLMSKCGT